jgi:hypothetical protein
VKKTFDERIFKNNGNRRQSGGELGEEGWGGGGGLSPAMLHRLKKNSLSIMASVMRTLNLNSEIHVFHIEKNTVPFLA